MQALGFECSAHDGRLYLWANCGAEDLRRQLAGIGLGNVKLDRGYVCLPGGEVSERDVVALGVDTWGRLWPEWLQGGELLQPSAVYWAHVTLFAWQVMEMWGYLPLLAKGRDGYEARWAPRFVGEQRRTFEEFVERMPDVARALVLEPGKRAGVERRVVIEQVMGWVVDAQVRRVAGKAGQRMPVPPVFAKWQMALSAPIAVVQGEKGTIERFHSGILGWQRGVDLEGVCGYRLVFRVAPPPEGMREGWMVVPVIEDLLEAGREYALRGVEDLELRGGKLAAEAAWRNFELASQLYPALQNYEEQKSDGLYLPGERVIEFLARFAPLLEQAGFAVERPDWWREGDGAKVELSGHLKSDEAPAEARTAMGSKVRLDWAALLGDRPVTMAELAELAKHNGEMQQIDGKWMRIDPVSVRDAMKFLKAGQKRVLTAREALREVLGMGGAGRALEVRELSTEGWIGELLRRLKEPGEIKELPVPEGLRGEMRPYQRRGFSWMQFVTGFGLGACLADDMGLGKSLQMLAMLASRQGVGRPSLLVCPTSVIGNWEREVMKFFPAMRLMVHHGVARTKGDEFRQLAEQHDLVVTSYSLLHRDHETLSQVDWDGIVLDEAQNIKNYETKQSRAARTLPGGYRVALTGTPVENHVGDLFSLMEFLNPGMLGTHKDFQVRFFKPIHNQGNVRATQQLKSLTAPFILRRLKTDKNIISDLPDKMEMKTYCKLTKEQARLYEDVVNGCFIDLEGKSSMERRGAILATIMRLKQVCNHPAQLLDDHANLGARSGKLSRLVEMLEEVREAGEKALIFSQFAGMGEILSGHLTEVFGEKVAFLHGGTPRLERDRMVEDFEKPDGAKLFVLSLKAGGTGLNLTAANHVFHYDRWWNPAVENQATDRAFRIGQKKTVQVHKFICMGTLEERIDQMVEEKRELAERVVEAGEVWLTELSNQELRDLFSLSREAWED